MPYHIQAFVATTPLKVISSVAVADEDTAWDSVQDIFKTGISEPIEKGRDRYYPPQMIKHVDVVEFDLE